MRLRLHHVLGLLVLVVMLAACSSKYEPPMVASSFGGDFPYITQFKGQPAKVAVNGNIQYFNSTTDKAIASIRVLYFDNGVMEPVDSPNFTVEVDGSGNFSVIVEIDPARRFAGYSVTLSVFRKSFRAHHGTFAVLNQIP